ncbi:hypothetical protein BJX68DRAFT_260208 [Aspergillus pseudodeflectus]|uniref:HNH nuclease domain-containing protein n=1 Tax=Aspergillus pseudodeflectus TaxID=176178 RepID=A0ABR4LB49_9EURO
MTTPLLLNSESLLRYGLPRAPGGGSTTLLLSTLTDLSFSAETLLQSSLQTAIRDRDESGPAASIQIWYPPKSALLPPLVDQHRYIFRRYYKDSKANIYGFAVLARRMKWKNFIVADELTKRQLRGESLEFEDESLTVVLVMFWPTPSKPQSTTSEGLNQPQEHVSVIVKRQMLAWDGVRANTGLLELLDTFQLSNECLDQPSLCIDNHLEDYGLELTDPGRAAFTPNDVSITGREELETLVRKTLTADDASAARDNRPDRWPAA